jgi:hypothetical protein
VRPDSYRDADAVPLSEPESSATATAAPPTPVERPSFTPPEAETLPLEAIAVKEAEPRDATQPFEVATATMTSIWEGGGTHDARSGWKPDQPLSDVDSARPGFDPSAPMGAAPQGYSTTQVVLAKTSQTVSAAPGTPVTPSGQPSGPPSGYPSGRTLVAGGVPAQFPTGNVPVTGHQPGQPQQGYPQQGYPPGYPPSGNTTPGPFPAPGTPGWFGPQQPTPGPNNQVTLRNVWDAATPSVLITLFLGALIEPFSFLMLLLSSTLSSRIKYRRSQIRIAYICGFAVTAILWGGYLSISHVVGIGGYGFFETLNAAALWPCRILVWVVMFLVYRALAARERPDSN